MSSDIDHILNRHVAILHEEKAVKPPLTFNKYAVSIFRGGIGKTTLAFNLAFHMAQKDTLLVIDSCPQRNLSELLLGGDIDKAHPTIYEALLPAVAAGFSSPKPGSLGCRISQTCSAFRKGEKSFIIPSSTALFLFTSTLYGALGQLYNIEKKRRPEAALNILRGLSKIIDSEAKELNTNKVLIDTSPFFGGATHLAWMAVDALIVPVRVDQASLEALDLTLDMLSKPDMEFRRYAADAGYNNVPKIHIIAMTHCGWNRSAPNGVDQSTQAFISEVTKKIKNYPDLFSFKNPLDSVVLLDDFHSAGRISGATRTPLANLQVGKFVTIEGKRLQVNKSLDRYQKELQFIADML